MKNKLQKFGSVVLFLSFFVFSTALLYAGIIDLPKTGQTNCYDSDGNIIACAGTGQDGELQTGVAWPDPRVTNHGDGTITDNLTGLMWTKSVSLAGPVNWQEALDFIAAMNSGSQVNFGYSDWRVPSIVELESLMNKGAALPSWLSTQGFQNIPLELRVWSSTTSAFSASSAWVADFNNVHLFGFDKSFRQFGTGTAHHVWAVRGTSDGPAKLWRTGQAVTYALGDDGDIQAGVPWPTPRFVDNGNGTVTDNLTGLVWLKDANCIRSQYPAFDNDDIAGNGLVTWQHALDFVAGINAGTFSNCGAGFVDWRLPNAKEMVSLAAYQFSGIPSQNVFNNFLNVGAWYRSSTTWALITNADLGVTVFGQMGGLGKSGASYVWPVRSRSVQVPAFAVAPSSLDFGPVAVGSSKDLAFTVQNTGGGTLNGSASTSTPFSIVGDNSFSLGPGESKDITVHFSPTSVATFNGNVNFTSNGGDASPIVTGTGVLAPALAVSPPFLDFNHTPVGSTQDLTFTVKNTGGGTLTGSASTSAPFSIVGDNSFDLAAEETKQITVRFSPTTAGIFNSNVTISSNAGNISVPVAGIGLVPTSNPKPPRIRSISPSSGVPGDTIMVSGSNFGPIAAELSLGDTGVLPLTWNDTFIQFQLPNIAAGKYAVQLTTSTAATARGSVTVLPPPPKISRILPTSGAPGTTVLIDGFNFGDQQGGNTITIGGQSPEIVSWSNERIAIKIPALAPKGYPIQLTTISGQAKAKFTVKPLLLLTEQGPCDDSFLGTLAGTCWVTVPIQTKQNSNGTVNISLQNIRARWYEVTVSGASFSGANPFLIGPNQTLKLNNVTIGPDGKISFYADGESTRAELMYVADLIFIAVTGKRMPVSLADQISSFMIGICTTASDLCSFASDLRDAIRSRSLTQIVSVLATLPIALASDPITQQSFIAAFEFSASQVGLIKSFGALTWLVSGVSVAAEELVYLTAPRFAKSCLLTPINAGTCQ